MTHRAPISTCRAVRRALLPGALLILGALVLFSGCSLSGTAIGAGNESRKASEEPSGPVVRADFQREILLTGELEAVRSMSIKSPQTSLFQMRITFMAEEGAQISAGEPVLDFDNSALASQVHELETQILDAETQVVAKRSEIASALKGLEIELAEKEYDNDSARVEASIDPDVLSQKDYSEKQLAHQKARKALEEIGERIELTRERGQAELDVLIINRDKLKKDLLSTQRDLELLSIKAPADGLVVYERRPQTTLRFQEGDSCWPGQGVILLPDLDEMQVAFHVSEVDATLLNVGDRVRITVDAFPGRELTGTIRHIPSMAIKRNDDSKVTIFKVLASLSETWVGEMKPGMSVMGRVAVQSVADAPLVTRSAVRFDGTEYWFQGGGPAEEPVRIEPLARNASHYLLSEDQYAQLTEAEGRGEPAQASMGAGS